MSRDDVLTGYTGLVYISGIISDFWANLIFVPALKITLPLPSCRGGVEPNKLTFYLNISWETKYVSVVTHFRKLSIWLTIGRRN